ncbi:MAG: transcription antitermination factor NusB [Candidatus Aegiribacteria sp.]|nr:transcription antitermination factor NusB [Candidatus Aegiribacteria sp.]
MGVRSRGRKALLQARYGAEVNSRSLQANLEDIRQYLADPDLGMGVPFEMEDWNWVSDLARAVLENRTEIDARLEEVLENWTVDRLSLVTRLILEQALGEMYYFQPLTPVPVAINEAIELAKAFDEDESAGFVNSVLDKIAKIGNSEDPPQGT